MATWTTAGLCLALLFFAARGGAARRVPADDCLPCEQVVSAFRMLAAKPSSSSLDDFCGLGASLPPGLARSCYHVLPMTGDVISWDFLEPKDVCQRLRERNPDVCGQGSGRQAFSWLEPPFYLTGTNCSVEWATVWPPMWVVLL
jgi:hypothetical protein